MEPVHKRIFITTGLLGGLTLLLLFIFSLDVQINVQAVSLWPDETNSKVNSPVQEVVLHVLDSTAGRGDDWETVQEVRRLQVQHACADYNQPTDISRPSDAVTSLMLLDDKHKVMFCFMPKVGCTSWKALLVSMQQGVPYTFESSAELGKHFHKSNFLRERGLSYLHKLSDSEIKDVLKTYTKVIAVRHPLQRLLSGYRDKFLSRSNDKGKRQCVYCRGLGREIIEKYRKNATNAELRTGEFVSELEFLQYVSQPRNGRRNRHFNLYSSLCNPCQIHYDYIVKMENITAESEVLLPLVFNSSMKFPRSHVSKNPAAQVHKQALKLTSSIKQNLLEKYGMDFRMFGYELP